MLSRKEDNKNFLDWVRQFSLEASLAFPKLETGEKTPLKHPKNSVSALIDVAVNVFFQSPISADILHRDPNFKLLYDAMLDCVKKFDEKAFHTIAEDWIKHTVGLALHLMFNENGHLQNPIKMELQIHQFSFEEAAKQLREEASSKQPESVYIDLLYRKLIGAFLFSLTQGLLLKKLLQEGVNDSDKEHYVNTLRKQQKVFLGLADARDSDLKDDLAPRMKTLLEKTTNEREIIKPLFLIKDNSYHQHARAAALQTQLEVAKMHNDLNRLPMKTIQGNVNRCLGEISKLSQPSVHKSRERVTVVFVRKQKFELSAQTAALLTAMQDEIDAHNCMDKLEIFREALQAIQKSSLLVKSSEFEQECLLKIKNMLVVIGFELGAIPPQSSQKQKEEAESKKLLQAPRDDMALCVHSAAAVSGHRHHLMMDSRPRRQDRRQVVGERQETSPAKAPEQTRVFGM